MTIVLYWCRVLLIAWIWLYESNCNNHHVREVVIEMKCSYSNALTDISKPSWSLCFGYSYSNNYHLHVSIHCATWILHCMAWMLMHRLDINIYIRLAWFDYHKYVICALDVLNALYTIYIESVYYLIYIWVYMQIFYKGFIILLLALVYIFIYINARIKVFI